MRVALTFVLLLAGCSSPANSGAVPTSSLSESGFFGASASTSTTSVPGTTTIQGTDSASTLPEAPEVQGPNAALIEFEVAWLCDVQRHTYDSPGAVDEALTAGLAEVGLDRVAYDEFKLNLSADPEARTQILNLFVDSCP